MRKLINKLHTPRPHPESGLPLTLQKADVIIFEALAEHHNPLADRILPPLSKAADHSLLWGGATVILLFGDRASKMAAIRGLLAIWVGSAITNGVLKLIFRRARPSIEVVPSVRRLKKLPISTSFPSGHATAAGAYATAVILHKSAAYKWLGPLAIAVGLSRVYVGVHYPFDVCAGAAVGAGSALLVSKTLDSIEQKVKTV